MSESKGFVAHVQTVVVSLVTGAIGWIAFSTWDNNTKIVLLLDKVARIEATVSEKRYASPAPEYKLPSELPWKPASALPAILPERQRK